MNPILLIVVAGLVIAQLALPTRLGFLPLIIAGCNLGNVEILPELTPGRLLILIGLGRALSGGFFVCSTRVRLDLVFITFSVIAILSSFGHKADQYVPSPLSARAGLVLNVFGAYLYGRAYLPDFAAFRRYAYWLPLVLIPLALGMTYEHKTRRNLYYILGATSEGAGMRENKIRAKGPFRHYILAGTAGATALPFALLMLRLGQNRKVAFIGIGSCIAVVMASASSGPAMAMGLCLGSVFVLWRWRRYLKLFLWGLVAMALLFTLITGRGPWFIMARIDLVGGSTGWHRAQLIDSGFRHLSEWWFWGTDYTRHWMPTGMRWNPNHTDITNYYLHLGVLGGLPLMISLISFITIGFRMLSKRIAELRLRKDPNEIALWCAGTSLAAHALSFVSISYFDQMYIFFYVLLGAIPGLVSTIGSVSSPAPSPDKPVEVESLPLKPLRFYS